MACDDGGILGLVSFSDPMARRRVGDDGTVRSVTPGHVGIIYQATNAYPCGRSTARTLVYVPRHGVVLPDRLLSKIRQREPGADYAEQRLIAIGARARRAGETRAGWLRVALDQVGATRVAHSGNYRYAWRLGSSRDPRSLIALGRTPNPKQRTGLVPAPQNASQLVFAIPDPPPADGADDASVCALCLRASVAAAGQLCPRCRDIITPHP